MRGLQWSWRCVLVGGAMGWVLTLALAGALLGQSRATIKGRTVDAEGKRVFHASVYVVGTTMGLYSDDDGQFRIRVPADRDMQLVIAHYDYQPDTVAFRLAVGETLDLGEVRLRESVLSEVRVSGEDQRIRQQVSMVQLPPKDLALVTAPFNDFSQKLATIGLGVVSNNELSSAYRVRGGSFDENLVYVNGIQVYRPFLARSGQQEGLGFVNPGMVAGVNFSAGGWQPRYGDKLSSVLDVEYRQPRQTEAAADLGLLGANVQFGTSLANGRIRTINGFRYKSARYLLNTLPVQGEYLPRFLDLQTYTTFDLSRKDTTGVTELGILGHFSRNRYEVLPTTRTTEFGTFQQSLRLLVAFEGDEQYNYDTFQGGFRLRHQFSQAWRMDWMGSALLTREQELINLESGYRLCDVERRPGAANFNECILTLGIGTEFDYSRNLLEAEVFASEFRVQYEPSQVFVLELGGRATSEHIEDQLYEYGFLDSAEYVLDSSLFLIRADNRTQTQRAIAYAQATHQIDTVHTLTYGFRANYWTYNGQLLISPRVQYAVAPTWRRDMVFKFAAGLYQQPAFYREMRGFSGRLNPDIRAQSALHLLAGFDWNYLIRGRQFKLVGEIYYKYLWNVIPYDVDNVRLRYYATNDARAYAVGADFRINGEFIEGSESWLSLSFLQTRENLEFDQRGWVRRPSDQLVTFAMFFQDHIPSDPSIKLHIRYLFGSGLPYGPPDNLAFRNALSGATTYNRVDFGVTKQIDLNPDGSGRSFLKSIWITGEVLNALGTNNNLSFTWVRDFNSRLYAIPNSLSQRFFNIRIQGRFSSNNSSKSK